MPTLSIIVTLLLSTAGATVWSAGAAQDAPPTAIAQASGPATTAPAAATAPTAASEAAPLPSVELPPELARVLTDYEKAWAAKDAAGLARLFAEDGFVLTGGAPPVRGRAAIEKQYAGSGGPLALRALAYATSGDVGYIIGGFAKERGAPDSGKFTLTLKRGGDGRWLIMSDMDNSNRRPQPPAPPVPPVPPALPAPPAPPAP